MLKFGNWSLDIAWCLVLGAWNFRKSVERANLAATERDCREESGKGFPVREGPAAYQLVGEVTAHQGYDG